MNILNDKSDEKIKNEIKELNDPFLSYGHVKELEQRQETASAVDAIVSHPGSISKDNDWSDRYDNPWTCDFCGQQFDYENDLLAHQFNSYCEPDG